MTDAYWRVQLNVEAAIAVAAIFCIVPALPEAVRALRGRSTSEEPFLSGLSGFCLMPVVALLGFLPCFAIIKSTAMLMGFWRTVRFDQIPNVALLLWTLLVVFLWQQVRYVMGLRKFWIRCRYLCALGVFPLAAQSLAWLALDYARRQALADPAALSIAADWSRLVSLGAVPFFMPAIHHRLLAPFFTRAGGLAGERARKIVVRIGNALFVAIMAALLVAFAFVQRTTQAQPLMEHVRAHSGPVPYGPAHVCLEDYPAISVRLGEQGTTRLAFRITTAGTVKDVRVEISSGSERLDSAAVACATQWRYQPAEENGRKVEVPWKAEIRWVLH